MVHTCENYHDAILNTSEGASLCRMVSTTMDAQQTCNAGLAGPGSSAYPTESPTHVATTEPQSRGRHTFKWTARPSSAHNVCVAGYAELRQAPQHTHLAADEEEQQSAKQQQEDVESLPDSVSFTPEQPMLNGSQLPSPCMLRDAVQVALRQIRMGGFSASSSNSSRCCTPPNEGRHICAPTQCSLSAAPPGSPWVPSPPGNPQSCRRRHQSHSQSFMHGCHAWSSVERSSLDQCLVSSKSTLDSLAAGGSTPTVDVTTSHACIHEEEAEEESGGYECHESRYTLTTSSEASDREEDEESSEESFEDSLFTPKSTQLFSASVLQRTAQHEPGAKQTLKNVIQSSPRAPKFLTYALLHLHDSQYMHEKHACTGERETVEQPSVCAPGSSSKPHALKCESEAAHLPEQSVSPRGGHRALRILSRNCSSSSSATAATALSNILESSPSHSGARSGMHDPSPSSSPPPPRDSYITATVHEGDVLRSPEEQTGSESSDNLQLFEEDAHTSVDKRTSHKEKESDHSGSTFKSSDTEAVQQKSLARSSSDCSEQTANLEVQSALKSAAVAHARASTLSMCFTELVSELELMRADALTRATQPPLAPAATPPYTRHTKRSSIHCLPRTKQLESTR